MMSWACAQLVWPSTAAISLAWACAQMVIDFTATWCGPCRYMEPAMNEFAAKYTDVEFIKIDVDELEDVAQEFEVHVLPTFLLIKKGIEVDKHVGANKQELRKKIEKHRV
ncbi:Thioredoxin H2 [Abeliophyllum distichum]|uniref:Thioredoxin H2 n=1 Tax=Abeliophyllum distichum TaxID=126358 RepID=A0ABD1W0A6_9LAMI